MAGYINTTDSDFEKDIVEKDKLVIVDMWAEWCGPCKMMEPIIEEVSKEYKESVKIVKLNIDQNQQTPMKFSVMNIPTLLFFKDKKEVDRIIGALPKNQLVKKIKEHI